MRLPYVDPESPGKFPPESGEAAIVSRVRARRSPRPLQPLDLTLLHAPNVADGWNSFLGAVRTGTSLGDDVREIAICRVAVCNGAWYEWGHHAPLAVKAGVSAAVMKSVGSLGDGDESEVKGVEEVKDGKEEEGKGKGEGGLTEKQWAVVRFTDEMTRKVRVSDEVFEEVRRFFSDQEVVELTATVAAYNCVSRFLVALDVGEKNHLDGPEPVGEGH